ncbi:MAG: hypothetical protein H6573_08465 [Lewinellaceae bacterium]|nr:hypothetical protein [Lewinellaceae bacterium]
MGDKIYIVDGIGDGPSSVESYDPATDNWKLEDNPPPVPSGISVRQLMEARYTCMAVSIIPLPPLPRISSSLTPKRAFGKI